MMTKQHPNGLLISKIIRAGPISGLIVSLSRRLIYFFSFLGLGQLIYLDYFLCTAVALFYGWKMKPLPPTVAGELCSSFC